MSNLLDRIEKDILKLNNQERAFLADRLLGLLDGESVSDIDKAWIIEAGRRYHEYKKGERPGVDAQEVFVEADRILK
ncbi:MAG: addiction module protein [Desulfobacteraceae bacterium]|nr:addiction module protein [Desulfobacteraceae bacterium]MBC2756272.1 addiction module protein [Desulfobacteraceae bacterium]